MLFIAQLLLQSLGHIQDVTAYGERIQGLIHGQHVFHQLRRHAIAHQRGPFGFQKQQLGRSMLWKQVSQRAESLGFMRSAATVVQACTLHFQVTEHGSD